ncbi:MAG: OmpA family protein [Piscinibacter sp.]|nr:OmpA family protein [Piscinibacter sp.]
MTIRRWLAGLAFACGGAASAQMPPDAAGARDHPVISRYAGSWLVGQDLRGYDELTLPSGETATARVDGKLSRLFYLGPAGRGLAEVQRNYEDALARAGAKKIDACAGAGCGARDFNPLRQPPRQLAAGKLEGWDGKTLTDEFQARDDMRYWYGTLDAAGHTLHVVVLSARSAVQALRDKHVATLVQVIEPKAMDTGMVTVDAAALAKGLQAQGRIALYGIFFDTGKAEIKPESRAQLDEMARLMQGNPALKVFVVGHTDNQGALEANLALSRQRAQAVADALVKGYRIDPKRLGSAGVAGYAPLAGNGDEAGRARNRRVELVQQ